MFDVDGVLANFTVGYTTLMNRLSDGEAPIVEDADQKTWDYDETVYPPELQDRAWNYIKNSGIFWLDLAPLVTQEELALIGDVVKATYFVTARVGDSAKFETQLWLERYVQEYPTPTVVMSSAKGQMAAAIKANYAIDDKAGNVIYGQYESPKTKWYILDKVYNQFDPAVVGSKVRRVKTVGEFLDDVARGK